VTHPRCGAWLALGSWLLVSCGRPAAEGGEVAKSSEVERAQRQAADPAAPAEPRSAASAVPVEPAPAARAAPVEPASGVAAADPQPQAAPPGSQPSAAKTPEPDPLLDARQAVPVSGTQDVPVPGELRLAMETFCEAVRAHDAPRLLDMFSRSAGFRVADSRKPKAVFQAISFDRLSRELAAKSGLYRALLEPNGLVQYVTGQRALPWLAVAQDEFAPRGVDPKQVWVRWRSEGDAWLVDTIALPAPVPRSR
jgi:hypothetical protein